MSDDDFGNDSYTETSTQGWFSRIGESIKGTIFGILLFLAAFPFLWWNEGRSVERYRDLVEGQGLVLSAPADAPLPANEGKLIHIQGLADTDETLTDAGFGVSARAIKLLREARMYQWQEDVKTESKEDVGGKKTTRKTYSYHKTWSDRRIDSSTFEHPAGHENPPMPAQSETLQAQRVQIGGFRLNASQIGRIGNPADLSPQGARAPARLGGKPLRMTGEGFYLGENPANPQIGDATIRFKTVKPADVSVVAQQSGNGFVPYATSRGGEIDLLQMGLVGAAAMFERAQTENTVITWFLRAGGLGAMWLGLFLVFRPLAVVGAVLPILGHALGFGAGLAAFILALPCALVTVALSWILHRPILAAGLLAAALALFVGARAVSGRRASPAHA